MPAGRERGRKRALKTATLVALVGLALAACAYGDAYAPERTPPAFAALDAADRAVQAQAFQHALENNKVGEGANWSNPESGHLGTVTPTRTYEAKSGAPCRAYQQTVTVAGETAIAHGTACRQADGTWKLAAAAGAGYRRAYAYPRYAYGYPYYAYGYPYYGFYPGYRYRYGYYPGYRYRYGHRRYGLFYPHIALGHFGGRHYRYGFGYYH